ncbi:MAG TPA: transglutaminase family protein [Nocardioidaceae bacterium]|nr:transglutaminase family protein [Nocardioidaceae bacterium]
MSMQLKVSHTTGYKYEGTVVTSFNEARMTPITAPGQLVLSTRLDVNPSPFVYKYRDYWGAMVSAFEVTDVHHELLVTSTSVVHVDRHAAQPRWLSWDDLRDPKVVDRMCEYLSISRRVAPGEELAARLGSLRAASKGPTDFARSVCALVHDEVEYVFGSTHVHSHADDAWDARAGVCQDLAHLCIGALRTAGVPARYVSGYLHPSAEAVVGETVVGESHAWIEWWDGAWVPFDPTNMLTPDNRYIVVAAGRDYADVAPLVGIFSGGDTSSMFVEVSVTRVE